MNGAQTRNVVVPSLCRVAPSGSAALPLPVAARKTAVKTKMHCASSRARSFPGKNRPNDMDNVSSIDCSLGHCQLTNGNTQTAIHRTKKLLAGRNRIKKEHNTSNIVSHRKRFISLNFFAPVRKMSECFLANQQTNISLIE